MQYTSRLNIFFATSPYAGVTLLFGTAFLALGLAGAAHWYFPDAAGPSLAVAASLSDRHAVTAASGDLTFDHRQPGGAGLAATAAPMPPAEPACSFTSDGASSGAPAGACARHVLAAQLAYDDGDASTPPLLYWVALWIPGSWADSAPGRAGSTGPACGGLTRSALVSGVSKAFAIEADALGEERPRSPDFKLPPSLVKAVISRVQANPCVQVVFLDTF